MKKQLIFSVLLLLLFQLTGCEKKAPADKMEWWKDAKFGLFIHWGIYSVPAGVYEGKDIPGIGEWIMNNAKIPVAEYEKYASQFNPVEYNAEEWVKLAKEAGMKYIVITSKHHDGFALFDSKVSEYDVMDATPFKRDIIGELAAACKKYDMPLGLYYSQAQDWHEPGTAAIGGRWDPAQEGDMDKYLDEKAVPQVTEILNNYGEIKILWWDTPADMTPERAAKFFPEMEKHPNLIYNDRLGGGFEGDLETPEQRIPATGIPGKNWESCMTMNDTWGFKKNDNNWKSTETLVRNLIDIASKGGNYLLNVGPTSMGIIPEPSVIRLKEVGAWMKTNGEAIYGTSANPFKKLDWGRCTKKINKNNVVLYFHVFDFPENGILTIPGLSADIFSAYALSVPNKKLKIIDNGNNPQINLSTLTPDPYATVIALEVSKDMKVYNAPELKSEYNVFIDKVNFETVSDIENAVVRYTVDGTIPTVASPASEGENLLFPENSFVLKAACFIDGIPVSGISELSFDKVEPIAAKKGLTAKPGLKFNYYEKLWEKLPDFRREEIVSSGICKKPDLSLRNTEFNYGFLFEGYINIPETGVYQFSLTSDDGSRLNISGKSVLNDGLHAMRTRNLNIALEKGLHPVEIQFFQAGGEAGLEISWKTGNRPAEQIPEEYWFYTERLKN
ncbi:MAG: alpha-L-fucosidase [Prolixibacteraceae bacterium]|nr:alpha-L-fucosidase [Prolixibacteraceae bacterium]